MGPQLQQSILDEIARKKEAIEECKRKIRRALGDKEACWQLEIEMRALRVGLEELKHSLELCRS